MRIDKSGTLADNCRIGLMEYEYSLEKDHWLLERRGMGFEAIIRAMQGDCLLEILDHHNQSKYPGQKIGVVLVDDYIYTVPFVLKTNSIIYLKTFFKNRKFTKKYFNKEMEYEKQETRITQEICEEKIY